MEKTKYVYEEPLVQVIEIVVENGFAQSKDSELEQMDEDPTLLGW